MVKVGICDVRNVKEKRRKTEAETGTEIEGCANTHTYLHQPAYPLSAISQFLPLLAMQRLPPHVSILPVFLAWAARTCE